MIYCVYKVNNILMVNQTLQPINKIIIDCVCEVDNINERPSY